MVFAWTVTKLKKNKEDKTKQRNETKQNKLPFLLYNLY